ncbi:hypothetical protein GF362_06890 [Candidatus Dojkabacteria bacterium]|nr:hypothetical protein [Candidatus Dojkabacteria bacterium]
MSSSIIKLIDSAIIPAALIILGKVLGLYIIISLFGLEWQMNFENNALIGVYPVVFEKDLLLASSGSDLIMLLVVLSGLAFETIRGVYFHNTHVDPKIIVRLTKVNLLGLVKDSFQIYYKASMWFVFSVVGVIYVILNSIQGRTFFWVPISGTIILIILTVLLIRDIELEIEKGKENLSF